MVKLTIDLTAHRASAEQREWDLPPWGHPLSHIVLPLFIRAGDRLLPAGTAFWVGRGISFILTATHTIMEAMKLDGRFDRALSSGEIPAKSTLKNVNLYVLHPNEMGERPGRFTLVPLETLNGGPPTDVIFGYPMFENGRMTGSLPLSFDPPRIGETVWSVGYRDSTPKEGLPFQAVLDNTYDWLNDYSHRLTVVEGVVERIFVERFARGFLEGPCFSFDNTIDHGLSGGPVITTNGRIVGINSAGAESYFDRPVALASMIYPLLATNIQFGAQMGPMRLNASRPLFDLVGQGLINTDGSEVNVSFNKEVGGDRIGIGPRIPKADHDYVHNDFAGLQDGLSSPPVPGPHTKLVRRKPEPGT